VARAWTEATWSRFVASAVQPLAAAVGPVEFVAVAPWMMRWAPARSSSIRLPAVGASSMRATPAVARTIPSPILPLPDPAARGVLGSHSAAVALVPLAQLTLAVGCR
jgi:hypothetical protein